eukprot:gene10434-biopygen7467
MLGFEVVKPGSTTPDPAATAHILEQMKARGVLLGKGGAGGNVLRVKPPLCVTRGDMVEFVNKLEDILINMQRL